jgi:endonuclease G
MFRVVSLITFFLTANLSTTSAFASTTSARTVCPQHFSYGQAPSINEPKLKPRSQEVCFEAFAVLHSGISRTPIYSAEHLTRSQLALAKKLSRKDTFHAEEKLPERDRSELADYSRSGYDRGHMSPNANMPSRQAQAESFSLANMVPQVHSNNAGVWAGIEGAARQLARAEGEIYVLSGPLFKGNEIKKIGNVLVPTHLWKVLFSPQQQRAGAYLISNDQTQDYASISVSELEAMTGLKLLPGVSQEIRDAGMQLPNPSSGRSSNSSADSTGSTGSTKIIDGANSNKKSNPEAEEFKPNEVAIKLVNEVIRLLMKAFKQAT